LTLVKKRHTRASRTTDLVTLDQQIKAKQQELALIEHRINQQKEELQIARKI
jgi:hypothetical protein